MQIHNKIEFRQELIAKIAQYRKQFPGYFIGNILVNMVIASILVLGLRYIYLLIGEPNLNHQPAILPQGYPMSLSHDDNNGGALASFPYVIILLLVIFYVFTVTLNGFVRNIRILSKIRKGDFDLEIESHEIDLAIEFIEDLPLTASEVEKQKIALSFGKIIEVLEFSRIIALRQDFYDLDVNFDCEVEWMVKKKK